VHRGVESTRTPEDTIDLIRQLAAHSHDRQIAAILNKQGRRTGTGLPFTDPRVKFLECKIRRLRRHRSAAAVSKLASLRTAAPPSVGPASLIPRYSAGRQLTTASVALRSSRGWGASLLGLAQADSACRGGVVLSPSLD